MKSRREKLQEAVGNDAFESQEVNPVTPINRPTKHGRSSPTKSGAFAETAEDSPSEEESEREVGEGGLGQRPIPTPLRAIPREGWGNGDGDYSDVMEEQSDSQVTPTELEDTYVPCMEDFYHLTTVTLPDDDSVEEEARV